MVSSSTLQIVHSTAPILAENAEVLTRHFYERLFRHNPEVRAFFNPAHQAAGSQQRALAGAITAYATHLGTPDVLREAVALIAHKHASLGVKPEHYPIVGEHLLASIQEVLLVPADSPIIAAWAEAYQALAGLLIQSEETIYTTHDATGGRGFAPFRIVRKERESAAITSFYLVRMDGQPLSPFKAGQYLTVQVPTADGTSTTMRNYSLSGPREAAHYRISVKREALNGTPKGYVSCYLHDHVQVGDIVNVNGPCGVFVLDTSSASRPLVLLSAGVGITPTLAMLHEATAPGAPPRDIVFVHAALNGSMHAFRDEVGAIAACHPQLRVHICYDQPQAGDAAHADTIGRIDDVPLTTLIPDPGVDAYFCGPKPFMSRTRQLLLQLGVPQNQQHYECFGPLEELN